MEKSYHTTALFKRHLPSNFIHHPAQLFANALGLFLVTMHDGILMRCANGEPEGCASIRRCQVA